MKSLQKIEFKPCPFCGANATIWKQRSWYRVSCAALTCDADGPPDRREREAIQKWNTRTG